MDGGEALGWIVAATAVGVAVWRGRRWRRWASEFAAFLGSTGTRGGSSSVSAPSGWNDELESIRIGAEKWSERLVSAEHEVRRLAGVIEGMAEGVVVIDGEGRVVLANQRAEDLLDLPSQESHEGRLLAELNRHPDLHQMVRVVREEGVWAQPMMGEIVVGASEDVTLQVTASRLPAIADMARWFVLVFHDISSIRRLERVRRDFVANVSHELRTPLAAISGYTETLLEGALDDGDHARRFLRIIERHSERLGRLVNDLLTLSDLELGKTELHRAPQNMKVVTDACFETLRAKAEKADVTLASDIPEALPRLDADADRLEQALLNLVDNAIKYTPGGGRVRVLCKPIDPSVAPDSVSTEKVSAFVEIAVSDTGVGVPPDDLARLTERFYRVDKARSRELGGTGLGLAIVKHIVHAHGGWMRIDSEPDKGTTVRLAMPAHSGEGGTSPVGA